MELASDFKVVNESVSDDVAKTAANTLEKAIGEIMVGKRKPGNIPVEEMIALIQFARNRTS